MVDKMNGWKDINPLRRRKKDERISSYIVRRVLGMLIAILLVTLFTFLLMQLPGLLY